MNPIIRLAYPDRRGQDNIRWCTGTRAARARSGGFTLDRALAGRRQASIEMQHGELKVTPLYAKCPTYILKNGDPPTRALQAYRLDLKICW